MRMKLSVRMKEIIAFVTPGNRVCDVGTDHGFVPIALVSDNICPSAIAVDVNQGPLDIARDNVNSAGLSDRIDLRLGDGLNVVKPDETDTVIISGMGGDLIASILENADSGFKGTKELILSPQSEVEKVRHKLHDIGYAIDTEKIIIDSKKPYLVIYALPGEESYEYEHEYKYGKYLLDKGDTMLFEYLKDQLVVFMGARNRISSKISVSKNLDADKIAKLRQSVSEVQVHIDEIMKLLKMYYHI